jgi:hypothetical protein
MKRCGETYLEAERAFAIGGSLSLFEKEMVIFDSQVAGLKNSAHRVTEGALGSFYPSFL